MKVVYRENSDRGGGKRGKEKKVSLPFTGLTVRAIVLRRSDRAVLGALHRPDGMYALPGGAMEDGENAGQALLRELDEEGIQLIGLDPGWQDYLAVDYYQGYNQLSLWYLLAVDGVVIDMSDELLDLRWFGPDQDPWYPQLKSKIQACIQQYLRD